VVAEGAEATSDERPAGLLQGRGKVVAREFQKGLVAGVRLAVTVVVVILALEIVFVVFHANAQNTIVEHISDWSRHLAGPAKDLFTPKNVKTRTAANYGAAIVFYLVAGNVAARLLGRGLPS
jgi:TRAP-type uncharacterized transport system fused permease subunit